MGTEVYSEYRKVSVLGNSNSGPSSFRGERLKTQDQDQRSTLTVTGLTDRQELTENLSQIT